MSTQTTSTPTDRFSLVALDMNGTTIKDSGIFQASLEHAYAEIELPLPPDDVIAPYRGMSKTELFARLIPDAGRAAAAHDAFTDAFLVAVADGAVQPMDGARKTLERLRDLGLRTCLITGFSPRLQDAIVTELGWDGLVDFAVSSDEVENGRPHPDLIERAAQRAGVAPGRLVVVGDTVNDVLAADNAGAGLVVGVLSGSHDADQLGAVAAAHLIDDISDLPDLIVEVSARPTSWVALTDERTDFVGDVAAGERLPP